VGSAAWTHGVCSLHRARLQAYQEAALRTQYSLAMLNFGQNLLFSMGFSASLLLVANEVSHGRPH
jgi:ABC-type transport system involved in Fe-S cluster assembly fused permease/ATPase subunit